MAKIKKILPRHIWQPLGSSATSISRTAVYNGIVIVTIILMLQTQAHSQLQWKQVDTIPLPKGVTLYYSNTPLNDIGHTRAYYLKLPLKNKKLHYTVDTTYKRRLTPSQYYTKNNQPLAVVNATYFRFDNSQNQNVIIKDGKVIAQNLSSVSRKNADSIIVNMRLARSAIGITKKRKADIAWVQTDSNSTIATAAQYPTFGEKYTFYFPDNDKIKKGNIALPKNTIRKNSFTPWNMQTAIGGGPALIHEGEINITTQFEQLFTNRTGQDDKHPRTAIGYTKKGYLIILVVEGRNKGIADGASLAQLASIMKGIGCYEALNLDGGGSSCMLVNGKETIKPSDATGQRAIPAVFLVQLRNK